MYSWRLSGEFKSDLERAARLRKVRDWRRKTRMDAVDATLVFLAKRESLFTILTVDRADFATYGSG